MIKTNQNKYIYIYVCVSVCVYVYIEIKKLEFDNTHCIIIAYERSINILSPDSFGKRKTSAFLFNSFVLEENSR